MATEKPVTKTEITPDEIRATIGLIESRILGDASELISDLKSGNGLKTTKKNGWHSAKMMGVQANSAVSEKDALKNWCNAARRSLT